MVSVRRLVAIVAVIASCLWTYGPAPSLAAQPGQLRVIDDDGAGFDVAAALERARHGATLGLPSMQERARLAGGTLEISSTPGQGTRIRARFPLDQPGGS